eukprot:TRINITY_DN1779_c0_g1_i4.p1 TRINITY_DN1779_c0_g1~~TRINITY_DN1779_c0_g1_i4.p1  ORF type:complete len:136 (+),score=15.45 TRINITY_DN1779_c0_g1_i4:400-807(+)
MLVEVKRSLFLGDFTEINNHNGQGKHYLRLYSYDFLNTQGFFKDIQRQMTSPTERGVDVTPVLVFSALLLRVCSPKCIMTVIIVNGGSHTNEAEAFYAFKIQLVLLETSLIIVNFIEQYSRWVVKYQFGYIFNVR